MVHPIINIISQYHQNVDINSKKYKSWNENHNYGIDHHGSADAIEKYSAVKMFCISVEKHNLRYTVYIGDGNTSFLVEWKKPSVINPRTTMLLNRRTALVTCRKEWILLYAYIKTNAMEANYLMEKTVFGRGCLTDADVDKI